MDSLVDPSEPPETQIARLQAIAKALMNRVESQSDREGVAFDQFERAVALEDQVRRRTEELERALDLLSASNAALSEANETIEAARRDLSSAIDAVQEGFAMFSVDDALLLYNDRFCWQMPDVREQLHPGLSFSDYIHIVSTDPQLQLPPTSSPRDWADMRIQRHRQPHVIFNLALKADRWLQISEHRTANGGTAILQTDVTDLMRAERLQRDRLVDNQSRIVRAMLDHLNQGVATFDSEGLLAGWNDRFKALTGLPPSTYRLGTRFDRVAEQLSHLFALEGSAIQWRLLSWKSGRSQEPQMFELNHLATGQILDVYTRPLPDDGFIVSFTDVTAERDAVRRLARTNEELEARVAERTVEMQIALMQAERSNASKSRFVAAASHDLLQPLSAAKLYLSTAEATDESPYVRKASEALSNVERIIEDLLDISRLDTDEEQFDLTELPLCEIFNALDHAMSPLAEAKGLRFKILPTSEIVLSDSMYLHRILQNLISNAIRYTDEGGVLVGARRRGSMVSIEVWDSGQGIRDEDRVVIFEEFRRLHKRASASEGLGLGLAIVERACTRLGHLLELSSRPGTGSVFRVRVTPSQKPAVSLKLASTNNDPQPQSLADAGLLVLLVDNDDELRQAMVTLLESWGVSVLDADDPATALDLLDEMEIVPDAMLIDYQLDHGATGLELTAEIFRRYGRQPTSIISADHSSDLAEECENRGLKLLHKPLHTKALFEFLAKRR